MANAAGVSAETASDQLTAVWNNFYDGSKSLEYYADVMAKLGAATASSTDEISEGLEKFAAVADTVGLSYEYATAALATVTSNTRQSADVVGTAFKTIFARMQDLELGETLDDGTTLGSYSLAMEKVGIEVLDTNGNLIEMDNILDQMAEKWNVLTAAQKVSLAQSVAGARQYTQLVSLMDNWDAGDADSMTANLKYTESALGTLQTQQDTYAEGWKAAQNRFQAAAETLYSKFIDDDFFIDLLDTGTKFLDIIDNITDSLGGMEGSFRTIASIMVTMGKTKIIDELTRLTGPSQAEKAAETLQTKSNANKLLGTMATGSNDPQVKVLAQHYQKVADIQEVMAKNAEHLTQEQVNATNAVTEQYEAMAKIVAKQAESAALEEKEARKQVDKQIASDAELYKTTEAVGDNIMTKSWLDQESFSYGEIDLVKSMGVELTKEDIQALTQGANAMWQDYEAAFKKISDAWQATKDKIEKTKIDPKTITKNLDGLKTEIGSLSSAITDKDAVNMEKLKKAISELPTGKFKELCEESEVFSEEIDNLDITDFNDEVSRIGREILSGWNVPEAFQEDLIRAFQSTGNIEEILRKMGVNLDDLKQKASAARQETVTWQQDLVQAASGFLQLSSALSSIEGLFDTILDDEASGFEKLGGSLTSILNTTMQLTMAIQTLSKFDLANGIRGIAERIAAKTVAVNADTTATGANALATWAANKAATVWNGTLTVTAGLLKAVAAAAPWLIGIGLVLSTAISIYNKFKDAAEEAEEKRREEAKATIEANKEEIETNKELLSSYLELRDAYHETGEGKEELLSKSAEVVKALGDEELGVDNLILSYEELTEKIKDAQQEQLKAEVDTNEDETEQLASEMSENIRESVDSGKAHARFDASDSALVSLVENSDLVKSGRIDYWESGNKENKVLDLDNALFTYTTPERQAEIYNQAEELYTQLLAEGYTTDNEVVSMLKTFLSDTRETVEAYTSSLDALNQSRFDLAQFSYDRTNPSNKVYSQSQFSDYYEGLQEAVYEQFKIDITDTSEAMQEQKDAADALIATYLRTNDTLSKFNTKLELANQLRDKAEETGNRAYNGLANLVQTDGQYNTAILQGVDWEKVLNTRANFDRYNATYGGYYNMMASKMDSAGLDINNIDNYYNTEYGVWDTIAHKFVEDVPAELIEFIETGYDNWLAGLSELADQAYKEYAQELLQSGTLNQNTHSLREKLQTGEVDSTNIAEDEDYKLILAELDAIKEAYPELETEANVLNKTWLAGTTAYEEALEAVSEKLDAIRIGKLNAEATELRETLKDIEIDGDAEAFYNTMDELLEKQYSIDVEIFANAEDDFKSVSNEISNLQNQLSKIGSDYTTDWDNIYELNKALPGIIDNITTAKDGTAQLNQQAVETAYNTAKEEIQAHALSIAGQLKLDYKVLLEKEEYYRNIATAAAQNAALLEEGEQIHADAVGTINTNLKELEAENAKISSQDQINYQELVATNSEDNAGILASNWAKAYQEAADASTEFARVAQQNLRAAVNTDEVIASYKLSLNYSGESGFSAVVDETSELKSLVESASSAEDWKKISDNASMLAENVKKQAEAIKGMWTQIDGAVENLTYSLDHLGDSASKAVKDLIELADRYHEITREIEYQKREVDKLSDAMDKAFGTNRLKLMDEYATALKKQVDLEQQLADAQFLFLASDLATVQSYFSDAQVDPVTQEITNYTELLKRAIDTYNSAAANDDNAKDLYDKQIEALEQYEETLDDWRDKLEEIQELQYKILSANYEKISYQLELNLDVYELDLEYIEYYLDKIADDFYAMAEAAEQMTNKVPKYTSELGAYRDMYYQITEAYRNADITQADYIDGMKEAYSGILDQLSALNDLDNEMMHYYEDTLDAASKELNKYTDRMEHLTSVLDHYRNLVELVNGEYDYESIGIILEGQAKTLKNELDVATEYYQTLLSERSALEKSLRDAESEAARELIQEELDAINTAIIEAQENVLSKTEEWAEMQKSVMENAMAEAAAAMEKAFTDGMGFDALSNSLDRLSSYADEYLTKTNQMYETQKLINTAQQASDKTNSEAAKARLKAYQDEVEELQNKNQLSNLELKIAKAKYDVVLAEIALEEAKNAKSTVRLQRDSEGNFGYVYTADQDAISQAEQDLADAQNNLYNIGLEGTNDYGQKLLELQKELADELIALEEARAAGQYATDEEYYAAKDQLIQEYNNLFRAYSEQYTTALGVDAAIQEEAWINAYENMILKTGDWEEKTTEYTGLCEEAFQSWRDVVESESAVVDDILNDIEGEVKDVTEASDDLRDEVVNEVIPAMEDEFIAVRLVTDAYADQREEILELISYYEELAQAIRDVIREQSGIADEDGLDFSKDYSLLMNTAMLEDDMTALYAYAKLRDKKIAAGYDDYGISTDVLLDWLLENGGVSGGNIDWKKILPGFASGGYTGSWGPDGRLAVLHEKELVLNKEDTANFLSATELLRDVIELIDLKALQERASTLPYNPIAETLGISNGSVEQSVRIEANFPNVSDRNEIQEAFNNLINTASQYANRK